MTRPGPIRSVEDMTNDRVTKADRFPLARVAAISAGAVFGAIAALHALWAAGAAWPFRDRQGMADVVWGRAWCDETIDQLSQRNEEQP